MFSGGNMPQVAHDEFNHFWAHDKKNCDLEIYGSRSSFLYHREDQSQESWGQFPIGAFVRGGLYGNKARASYFYQFWSAEATDLWSFKFEATCLMHELESSLNLRQTIIVSLLSSPPLVNKSRTNFLSFVPKI